MKAASPVRDCVPREQDDYSVEAAALVRDFMHLSPEQLMAGRQISNLGGMISGVNNNGNHSANGIAALFIATGQDAANVADRRDLWRRHRTAHPA